MATRYRPIHIATLLLGAYSPGAEDEYLYSGKFAGEAGGVLEACGISAAGKAPEVILSEFQRAGFFLAHLNECPLEESCASPGDAAACLEKRIGAVAARIRRSLRPKRVVLISEFLAPLVPKLSSPELGCEVRLAQGKPFALNGAEGAEAVRSLREAIRAGAAAK